MSQFNPYLLLLTFILMIVAGYLVFFCWNKK